MQLSVIKIVLTTFIITYMYLRSPLKLQAEFRGSVEGSFSSTYVAVHTVRQRPVVTKAGIEGEECRG